MNPREVVAAMNYHIWLMSMLKNSLRQKKPILRKINQALKCVEPIFKFISLFVYVRRGRSKAFPFLNRISFVKSIIMPRYMLSLVACFMET